MCQNHYFWWLWSECSPLPIPNREVKPHIADDTALVCGKVGRRQSFKEHSERDALFFAQVPRLHHGRGALQLADEDLLHWIRFNSAVFSSPYGVPPGSRRTLRRHRAQRQTALQGLQETLEDVILHRHPKTTKAEASNGLGFRFCGSKIHVRTVACVAG